jgi:hypothetical protein
MAPDTISQLKMLSWKWCQGSRTDPNIRYMEDIWPHQLKHPMVKIVLWWLISEKHTSERPAEPSWDVREVHRHGMGKRGLLLEIASDSCSDKWSVSRDSFVSVCCFTQPGEWLHLPMANCENHPPSCSHKYMYAEHYILTQLMYTDLWLHHDFQPIMNQSPSQASRPKMQPRCFSPLLNYRSFTAHEWWDTPNTTEPSKIYITSIGG